MQRRKLVVAQHVEVNLDVLGFDSLHNLTPLRTAVNLAITLLLKCATLRIQNSGLLDLVLHYQFDQLLFFAIFSDHVADFVNNEHIVYLFRILYKLFLICLFSLRVFLRSTAKSRKVITILKFHGCASDD